MARPYPHPEGADIMVVPQKPYIPIGSLRSAIRYPAAADIFSDDESRKAWSMCDLQPPRVSRSRGDVVAAPLRRRAAAHCAGARVADAALTGCFPR